MNPAIDRLSRPLRRRPPAAHSASPTGQPIAGRSDADGAIRSAGLAPIAAYAPDPHRVVIGGLAEFPDAAARLLLLYSPGAVSEGASDGHWILTALDDAAGVDAGGAGNAVVFDQEALGMDTGGGLTAPAPPRGMPSGSATAGTRGPSVRRA